MGVIPVVDVSEAAMILDISMIPSHRLNTWFDHLVRKNPYTSKEPSEHAPEEVMVEGILSEIKGQQHFE